MSQDPTVTWLTLQWVASEICVTQQAHTQQPAKNRASGCDPPRGVEKNFIPKSVFFPLSYNRSVSVKQEERLTVADDA